MKCADILTELSPLSRIAPLVVAGGAVRDELLNRTPKDFDVFLLLGKSWSNEVAVEVKDMTERSERVKPIVEWHKSEPFLIDSIRVNGFEVQLMQSPFTSIETLVRSFDWNVCLFATDGNKTFQLEHEGNIAPGKALWLQKVTAPYSTLRRGYRFSERFLMTLEREDVQKLCKLILN